MPIRHHPFLFLFSRAQLIILSRVQKGLGADGGVVQKGSGADGMGGGAGAEGFWGRRWPRWGGGGLQGAARVSDTFRNCQIWKFMKVIKTP